MKLIYVDLETNSLIPETGRIISICTIFNEKKSYSLINPECPIPKIITEITGLTDEEVCTAPTFKEISKDLWYLFNSCDVFCAYNGSFDYSFLSAEFRRVGLEMPAMKLIDPLKIWRKKDSKKLGDAFAYFCNKKMINGHNAAVDTEALKLIFEEQVRRYDLTLESSIELSTNLTVLQFGKHKGKSLKKIKNIDATYLAWLLTSDFVKADLKKEIKEILKK